MQPKQLVHAKEIVHRDTEIDTQKPHHVSSLFYFANILAAIDLKAPLVVNVFILFLSSQTISLTKVAAQNQSLILLTVF